MKKYGNNSFTDKEITGLDLEELLLSFGPTIDHIYCSIKEFDSMCSEDVLFTVLPWSNVNSIFVSENGERLFLNISFANEHMQIHLSQDKSFAGGEFLYEQLVNIAMLRKYKVDKNIWDGYVFEKMEELEFADTENAG